MLIFALSRSNTDSISPCKTKTNSGVEYILKSGNIETTKYYYLSAYLKAFLNFKLGIQKYFCSNKKSILMS